jgi:hypothetical protein
MNEETILNLQTKVQIFGNLIEQMTAKVCHTTQLANDPMTVPMIVSYRQSLLEADGVLRYFMAFAKTIPTEKQTYYLMLRGYTSDQIAKMTRRDARELIGRLKEDEETAPLVDPRFVDTRDTRDDRY